MAPLLALSSAILLVIFLWIYLDLGTLNASTWQVIERPPVADAVPAAAQKAFVWARKIGTHWQYREMTDEEYTDYLADTIF
jgi:hypothetical protein